MSDSHFSLSKFGKGRLSDVVDDEWAMDALSDPEIEVTSPLPGAQEHDDGEGDFNSSKKTRAKWTDLGLEEPCMK